MDDYVFISFSFAVQLFCHSRVFQSYVSHQLVAKPDQLEAGINIFSFLFSLHTETVTMCDHFHWKLHICTISCCARAYNQQLFLYISFLFFVFFRRCFRVFSPCQYIQLWCQRKRDGEKEKWGKERERERDQHK